MTSFDSQSGAPVERDTASIVLRPPKPRGSSRKRFQAIIALLVLLAAVLFLLPGLQPSVETSTLADVGDWMETNNQGTRVEQTSPLSDAEALVFRREAQDLLVEIVDLKNALLAIQVTAWAAEEYASIEADLANAESQYQQGEYSQAKESYEDVRAKFGALQDSFQPRLDEFLKEADAAVDDYRAGDALRFFEAARNMDAGNTRALNGVALATVLPEIQELMTEAINCRSRQDLNCALQHTERAVALNAEFSPAGELRDSLKNEIVQRRYQAKMSQGFLALDQQRWDAARNEFDAAEKILPQQSSTAAASEQLAAAREQIEVTQLLDQARLFEAQEDWDRAKRIYERLLRRDPSLVDPAVRLVTVKTRAEIAAKYRRFLDDPMLLTRERDALEAEQLLRDTSSLTSKSSLLAQQHQLLSKNLATMKMPREIAFTSDGQTQVTVYKVAALGRFNETTLTLKPGKYIASGNRQGYRDVRVEFVVGGDPAVTTVSVACVDMI